MRRVTVGDVAEVVSGGTPARNRPEFWGGRTPWVKTGAIDFCFITESDEWITEEGLENSAARIIPAGTILIAMYGQGKTRGQVAILGIDAAKNQACAALLLREGCDRDFVYQQLAFRYTSIRKMSNSGGQDNLNADLVRSIALLLPEEGEQRKIGALLKAWDGAVSILERLIDAKRAGKRGLMQQLLTGKTRFKEFKGERWRALRLGELLQELDRYVTFDDEHTYRLASVRRRSEGLFFREALRGEDIKTKVMKTIRTGDFLLSKMQVVHGAWGLVTPEFDGMFVSDSYIALVPRVGSGLQIEFFN
jgi:type I restriction enzyme, S subunit